MDEILDQERDVGPPFAKCGHFEWKHVEPVEEVSSIERMSAVLELWVIIESGRFRVLRRDSRAQRYLGSMIIRTGGAARNVSRRRS